MRAAGRLVRRLPVEELAAFDQFHIGGVATTRAMAELLSLSTRPRQSWMPEGSSVDPHGISPPPTGVASP
jgi:hypothetical protein